MRRKYSYPVAKITEGQINEWIDERIKNDKSLLWIGLTVTVTVLLVALMIAIGGVK